MDYKENTPAGERVKNSIISLFKRELLVTGDS